jgi:Protein of unknown function (DUF229)
LYAVFPKTFKEKFPLAVEHFKTNSKRLTTHFDVFETLKDLSNLNTNILSDEKLKKRSEELKELANLPRGISLFLEVPGERTCNNAGIDGFVDDKHDCSRFDCIFNSLDIGVLAVKESWSMQMIIAYKKLQILLLKA